MRAGKPIDSALAHARSSGTPEDAARSWLDQVRPADFVDPMTQDGRRVAFDALRPLQIFAG